MSKRNLLALMFCSMALAVAPLTACGGTEDPSGDDTVEDTGGEPDAGDEDVDPVEDTNPEPDAEPDADTEPDTDPQPGTCVKNSLFFGQVGDFDNDDHSGGVPSTTAELSDAGLGAYLNLLEPTATEGETPASAVITLDTPVEVTGAIVIATSFKSNAFDQGQQRFWVQDANGVAKFYLDEAPIEQSILVGDELNFTIESYQYYAGQAQIKTVSGFEVVSSNNDVPFVDIENEALSMDLYQQLVRVGGELVGEPEACGGSSMCYTMVYGDEGQFEVVLRSSSGFLETGDCVTYMGPVIAFPHPYDSRYVEDPAAEPQPSPQLDTINFGWLFDPPSFED
ncbi:hypothetical protein FRC98_16740 [Lujinxingia vulgaris]|uniref:Uncharacterized protein n=1 Tax=Lujinxingia vulgaris TaxID=2600176 RepID=A0A5C6XBJ6_9DELT|nr:hypothetical protein [Lujinxingia vulgaris]TXD35460.1 hypothetical protein FRC98_16740 [Lujinxingia vulgaris]